MENKDKIRKSESEWQAQLSPEEYAITRLAGTERPFTGRYNGCKTPGTYSCVCCGQPLFSSKAKYDSGSGWPSFWEPIEEGAVELRRDTSHGMIRTEVLCPRCDAHLGHEFDDGPQPTGKRFCMNSAALKLTPEEDL